MKEVFNIAVEQAMLDDLAERLTRFRTPPSPEVRGWQDGIDLSYLGSLVEYWRYYFNWRAQEVTLNKLNHFVADVGGAQLHFVHELGRGPVALPLLLIHGWPDGFQRFVKLIPLLTDPGAHGGDPVDAFDVVIPSLPGFGFSSRLAEGTSRREFGILLHQLMTEVLNYGRYGAHGGDIGAGVCDQLYRDQADSIVGSHFTNVPMSQTQSPAPELSDAERQYFDQVQRFQTFGGGYMHIQGTKPWTPSAALNDSPAGLAAWIVEKFYEWSDCHGNIESRFSKDELLTNVMLYWITQSIGTSFLAYRDFMKPAAASTQTGAARHSYMGSSGVPAGFAVFPRDIANAPREWAERFYNVQHWTEMAAGGHFAALEEPELLARDLRTFFRPLRSREW